VVQAGKESRYLGELVVALDGDRLTVEAYQLHLIDDTIVGDRAIAAEIDKLKTCITTTVFASRGYSIDQPLAVAPRDIPNTFTDILAGTPLANLVTDSFRQATGADIGLAANGMMRAGLTNGNSGVQTVYDVATASGSGVVHEIKEWQAIMDYLRDLPVDKPGELPTIPIDGARLTEIRAMRAA
jgi:5'-nucleotidase/UDP-sugar diphosphatase